MLLEQNLTAHGGALWGNQIAFLPVSDQLSIVLAGGALVVLGSALAVGRFLRL